MRCASWDCENNDLIQIYLAALIFVPYGVPAEVREFEVERKFDEFRRARLVITDRLHGMIFAAITGTPCIALNNSSGKVEGVWSLWLRHLDYVKFVREAAEIPALLDAMLGDQTLFIRSDVIAESWKLFTPVLENWGEQCPLAVYEPGTDGPEESFRLLFRDGREWRPLVPEL